MSLIKSAVVVASSLCLVACARESAHLIQLDESTLKLDCAASSISLEADFLDEFRNETVTAQYLWIREGLSMRYKFNRVGPHHTAMKFDNDDQADDFDSLKKALYTYASKLCRARIQENLTGVTPAAPPPDGTTVGRINTSYRLG